MDQIDPFVIETLKTGGIAAYPTESVFGLGCDPNNPDAVKRLLALKQRPVENGLILIADKVEHLLPFTAPVDPLLLQHALDTWPGPVTWIFPAANTTPDYLTGTHNTIAIRVTAHPLARTLCQQFGGALVSTSANPSGQLPAKDAKTVDHYFGSNIDALLDAPLGGSPKPTQLIDLFTKKILR